MEKRSKISTEERLHLMRHNGSPRSPEHYVLGLNSDACTASNRLLVAQITKIKRLKPFDCIFNRPSKSLIYNTENVFLYRADLHRPMTMRPKSHLTPSEKLPYNNSLVNKQSKTTKNLVLTSYGCQEEFAVQNVFLVIAY